MPDTAKAAPARPFDFPLASRTGYLLHKAGVLLIQDADRALEAQGMRLRYFYVLGALESRLTLSQQDLSRLLNLDPTTMVALIDELEEFGHVERRRNPTDRRRYMLHLTDKGRAALTAAQVAVDKIEAEFLAPVSAADRERLPKILGALLADRWPAIAPCD